MSITGAESETPTNVSAEVRTKRMALVAAFRRKMLALGHTPFYINLTSAYSG